MSGYIQPNTFSMFRNYLKTALRNSLRQKGYTLINTLGLAIGISVFILLFIYIRHERSFNMYNSKAERVYRIVENRSAVDEAETKTIGTSWAMAGALKSEFPEVEEVARVFLGGSADHAIGEQHFLERNYFFAEKSYFDVFDHTFIAGNVNQDVGNIGMDLVLSESTAKKYFGEEEAVGKTVDVGFGNCRVVAVYKDLPLNASFRPDFIYLTDLTMWPQEERDDFASWESRNCGAFVVLRENAAAESLLARKEQFLKAHLADKWKIRDFELQPMEDFHLRSVSISTPGQQANGNYRYTIIFGLIAVFVLVIAIINYVNLATAHAIFRRKEVGIRKVAGASRRQLITQFLVESLITAFTAFLISLCLIEVALPWFNDITERAMRIPYFEEPQILLFLAGIGLITGVISGLIPAYIISAFQPGDVLHGFAFQRTGKFLSRKVLVVFQFSLSIIMIISTLVVYRQMKFVQNRDMGFDKSRKLVIDINYGNVRRNFKAMKAEFLAHSDVRSVAAVSRVPGEWKTLPSVEVTKHAGEDPISMNMMGFDPDALATLGMELIAGEGFTGNDQLDSLQVLVNEKAAALFGGENSIGQHITVKAGSNEVTFRIRGIVQDFNFESLYEEIGPMIIGSWNNGITYIDYFVLDTMGDPARLLAHAEAVHKKFAPEGAIEYNFLDRQWERFYKDDVKRGNVFAISAGLAIFIACLGLLGLASFSTSQRVKEIGIRKVLGATDGQLISLITKEFLQLVLLGFVIAAPVAWWLMDRWLSTYAYNTGISVNLFVFTGLSVLVVALATVGYKSLQAARRNPASALRNE